MPLGSITSGSHPRIDQLVIRLASLGLPTLASGLLVIAVCFAWIKAGPPSPMILEEGQAVGIIYDGELTLRWVPQQQVVGQTPHFTGWMFLGFGGYKLSYASGYNYSFVLPLWFLALAFSVLPAIAVHRSALKMRLQRRRKENRCLKCGYDLRGSIDVCSECGRAVGAVAGQADGA